MSVRGSDVYKLTTCDPGEPLNNLHQLDDTITNTLASDNTSLSLWKDVYVHIEDIDGLFEESAQNTSRHYLFNYMQNENRRGEDINVRLGHDLLSRNNRSKDFILQTQMYNTEITQSIMYMQIKWDIFLIEANLTSLPNNIIEEWNETINQCITLLIDNYNYSNLILQMWQGELTSLQRDIQGNPKTNKYNDLTEIGDVEFFL